MLRGFCGNSGNSGAFFCGNSGFSGAFCYGVETRVEAPSSVIPRFVEHPARGQGSVATFNASETSFDEARNHLAMLAQSAG